MSDEATCGTGMAQYAALPMRMAELTAALADVLTRHTEALDTDEPAGAQEREAWLAVASEHRDLTARLSAAGDRMASYGGMPSATHDLSVLTAPEAVRSYEHFAAAQLRLHDLLAEHIADNTADAETGSAEG